LGCTPKIFLGGLSMEAGAVIYLTSGDLAI